VEVKRNAKKTRAALVAGALAGTIALTGTLAWINMSQEAANEFMLEKNPGGRIHDDFKGTENKDVYAENFSSLEDGAPIFVRVKLLEYMETGADAGVNRKTPEGADVPMKDRNVKPLVAGADVNDTSTWYTAKPGEPNPFRVYWTWEQSGKTVYMPTFNKNKDSVSVDVNGTYVGADGKFEEGEPYDDYVTYALGTPPTEGEGTGGETGGTEDDGTVKKVTADAFYDADKNTDDEYEEGVSEAPGAGGVEVTEENPEGNFLRVEETHYGAETLNSLGVITMDDWIEADRPVCNKWVWDADGWFYWPEPVMPQTATGLLLDKVISAKAPSEKCYYAIDVVGQFVDSDRSSWGSPETTNAEGQKVDATGFYVDGVTDNALDLLDQASRVEIVTDEETKAQTWYLGQGSNVYRQITGDEGTLGDPLCAGPDITPATEDDRADIEYVSAGITVGDTDYGNYFLRPRPNAPYNEDYYRAVGKDGLLGTADDDRLWTTEGSDFPLGMTDKVVDAVTVSQADNTTQLEVNHSLTFSAKVQLNGADAKSQDVTWSVAPGGKLPLNGTSISDAGVLTVGENEPNTQLIITATSKLDDRQKSTYTITVLGKSNVQITTEGGVASLQAGKTLQFTATACHGSVPLAEQPTITWNASAATRMADVNAIDITQDGKLTVGRNKTGSVVVTATYTNEYEETVTGTKTIVLTDAEAVTVTLTEPEGEKTLEAGQTLSGYTAAISGPVEELGTQEITWKAGTSTDNGQAITTVTGITMPNGVLTVAKDYDIARGDTIYIQAIAKDVSAKGAKAVCTQPVTIIGPDSIEITVKDGKSAKVNPGKSRQLIATVKRADGSEYASQAVKWEISGSSNTTGTTINQSGLLTAASDENVGGRLVVTATSKVDPSLSKTMNVSVVDEVEIDGREVTIDGDAFIVLTQDEAKNQTLLLLKTPVEQMAYASSKTATWGDSNVKAYLNNANEGGWLNGRNELQNMLKETTVYSVIKVSVTNNLDKGVPCKVFLLSYHDLNNSGGGSTTYKMERTAGGKLVWPNGVEGWRAFEKDSTYKIWWLRSNYEAGPARVAESGDNPIDTSWYVNDYTYKGFVRPAMWVDTTKLAPYFSGS